MYHLRVLERLTEEWDALTPEAQKAARYVLENPADVGVSTVREIAEAANVKPNTFVRMARQVGFEGYEDFRAPFREAIRKGGVSVSPTARAGCRIFRKLRASWVGSMPIWWARRCEISRKPLRASTPKRIWRSGGRRSGIRDRSSRLGVGVNNSNARNFTYLASTGMKQFHAIPRPGSTAVDDLAWADEPGCA